MVALFNFIILVILVIFGIGVLFAYFIYRQIHRAANTFKDQMNGAKQQRAHQNRTYGNEETIIDQRSQKEAGQKIFRKDEGEYVDFQEVDEQS